MRRPDGGGDLPLRVASAFRAADVLLTLMV
jgi:hypothetical protein